MAQNPTIKVRRPYPKAEFELQFVQNECHELQREGATCTITADDNNYYLTTVWPPLGGGVEAPRSVEAVGNRAGGSGVSPLSSPPDVNATTTPDPGFGMFQSLAALDYPSLKSEYEHFFGVCTASPQRAAEVVREANRVFDGRQRYETVSIRLGGKIPWYFIAIVHYLEANCSFLCHLHNGDPMFRSRADGTRAWLKTVNDPKGRPDVWPPPTEEGDPWIWSAMDALEFEHCDSETDWSVPKMLWRFERYNGMGYRQYRNPSPYLWSFSQIYKHGKFDLDHHYVRNLISDQCGAALILKDLLQRGVVPPIATQEQRTT